MRVFNAGIATGFTVNNSGTQPQPQGNTADLQRLQRELLRLKRLLAQVQEVKPSVTVNNSSPLVEIPMGRIS